MPVKDWLGRFAAQRIRTPNGRAAAEGLSYAGTILLLLICMASLAGGTYNPFIYFRF